MADTVTKQDYSLKFPKEGLLGRDVDVLRFLQARLVRKSAVHAVKAKNTILRLGKKIPQDITGHKINQVRTDGEESVKTIHEGLQSVIYDYFGIGNVLKQDLELAEDFFRKHGAQMTPEELALAEKFLGQRQVILDALRKYVDELVQAMNGKELAEGALNIAYLKYRTSSFFHPINNFFEWWTMRSAAKGIFKIEDRMKRIEEKNNPNKNDFKQYLQYDKVFTEDLVMTLKNISIYMLILIRNAHEISDTIMKAADPKYQRFDLPQSFTELGEEFVFMLNDNYNALKSINKARLQLQERLEKAQTALKRAVEDRRRAELAMKRIVAA